VYGWSRNPSASEDIEKLIEYYIVDDWFYNVQCGLDQIGTKVGGVNQGEELGSFTVDGATYKIYKNPRINQPSIDGDKTFIQIFSVPQGRRTNGTISVTEHFKAWSKYIALGNMYEAKFKVETFGGNGNLDLTYLYLSQEETRRNIPAGTTPIE
jgi:endo-1,4-beta-xylanase